jgi:hypothetical protein
MILPISKIVFTCPGSLNAAACIRIPRDNHKSIPKLFDDDEKYIKLLNNDGQTDFIGLLYQWNLIPTVKY